MSTSPPVDAHKSRAGARTVIIVPTFNEVENLPRLSLELRETIPDADIVVVEDNSPDGTGRVADQLAREWDNFQVIHRPGRQGLGSAHVRGLRHAMAAGYDVAVTMDCDMTHDPRAIPMLLGALDHHRADVVVASRYTRSGRTEGWTLPRRALSGTAHLATRLLLDMKFDATNAFRVWRVSRLRQFDFDRIRSAGYAFMFEILFLAQADGMHIVEIPVRLPVRHAGYSKMSTAEMLRSASTLGRLARARWQTRGNPGGPGR